MIRSVNNDNHGVGFVGLLQIAFIVLKLCKVIDWSWWWVLAPTWMCIIFVIGVVVVYKIWKRFH